ncbi:hypothetical protein [Klebsiella pneumoniae]|uniref:hypothetical protein n=1 Tax=Klebsiella pneumoniae TaxID=573 RepID=UPI00200D8EEB|nr:hypothetical protein [Klebsiella pneumoniae]UPY99778.1 hypothetical protein MOV22_26410 [Klebsiella pneumoniae]
MIETTLLAVLTGALSNLTSDAIKGIIGKLASKHPEVEQQAAAIHAIRFPSHTSFGFAR